MTTQEIIEVIKGLSVLELNDLVKACEEEFGVSAAAGVVVAAAGAAGAAVAASEAAGAALSAGAAEDAALEPQPASRAASTRAATAPEITRFCFIGCYLAL